MQRTYYYRDELKDEFAGDRIQAKTIDGKYSYLGGPFWKLGRGFWYHLLAKPLALCYMKLVWGHRIENKQVLQKVRGQAYFLYGNHTNPGPDALIPTMVNFNRSVYVIVHPNNVSMPVLGRITPCLGALPLPDTREAMKHFSQALRKRVEEKAVIMIYPEAHIWPFYTKIRPFKKDSFGYPIDAGAPVVTLTNTYQKRRFCKRPRMVTYLDGPFYADSSLPKPQQKQALRDAAYQAMVERSKKSNVELTQFIKLEDAAKPSKEGENVSE